MNKKFLLSVFFALAWFLAMAVPAKPGFNEVRQSDGTTLKIQAIGDEWYHLTLTADNLVVSPGEDGDYYYLTTSGISAVRAHDAASRTSDEISFIEANREVLSAAAFMEANNGGPMRAPAKASSQEAAQLNSLGSKNVPILLVNFSDRAMRSVNTKEKFEQHFISDPNSAYQYFYDQSNGKFQPQFKVYGIYNLPHPRSYYGTDQGNTHDVTPNGGSGRAALVRDAIIAAQEAENNGTGPDIDWASFNNDGKNGVDVCIVVYPGVSEAATSGAVSEAIWPARSSFTDAGMSEVYCDNNATYVNAFAVFNELAGTTLSADTRGNQMDGIGTFCHEFSHCLGLPDFYPTSGSQFGMSKWSIMGTGNYNNDSNTPIGYSAYEKNFMHWIDLITPEDGNQYTLPVFNKKTEATDQAVKITGKNPNEYWILENRRRQGWDAYIPAQGLLINHYTYVKSRWTDNTVNNKPVQLATFMPADNDYASDNLYDDTFGNGNYSFTSTSKPAMLANMYADGSLASTTGGAGAVDKPVTEITINSTDKTVSFWYNKGTVPALSAPVLTDASNVQATSFTANWTHTTSTSCTYTLNVTKNGSPVFEREGITAKTFTVTGLTSGETYDYKVKAVPNDATQATASAWSTSKSVTLPQRPAITTSTTSVEFTGFVSRSYTQTVNVTGVNLSQDITATLNDNQGIYSIDKNNISKTANGATLTITWTPTAAGHSTATIVLKSTGADDVTINLAGDAQPATPTLFTNTNALSFAAAPGRQTTKTIDLTGCFISGDVTLTLNDPKGVFSIEQATIPASNISEESPVSVAVSFSSAVEGTFNGTLTLSSAGAESKTVALNAMVSNGGKASDAYLDIANYETINDAGAVVEGMDNIYTYDNDGWLTVSNYGAMKADATQEWIDNSLTKSYRVSWNANDVFPASNAYFGQNSSYACDQDGTKQIFYVTNCSQVKQYVTNRTKLWTFTMRIYECTQAADGSLVAGAEAVDTQESAVYGFDSFEVLTSNELDPNKIYKVEIINESSYMYATAFKTGNAGGGSGTVEPVVIPALSVTPDNLTFSGFLGDTMTETITVTGENLTGNVAIACDNDNFAVSTETIAANELADGNGVDVTVTFNPQEAGNYTGALTLTSGDLTQTVSLSGAAQAHTPVLAVNPETLNFNALVGNEVSNTFTITGEWIADDVTIACDNDNFAVSAESIAASELADGNGVDVTVTFNPQAAGDFSGAVTLTSGDITKTVELNGVATFDITAPTATLPSSVTFRSFIANWQACPGATSYTLRVMPKRATPPVITPTATLLMTENFTNCTHTVTDFLSLDSYTDNPGWLDTRVYVENGGLRIGSKNPGSLTSPALDLSESNGKVSVKVKAKAYNNDTDCSLTISCGESTKTVDVPNSDEVEYAAVLDCTAAAGQNVVFKNNGTNKRVILTSVEFYSGDITAASMEAPSWDFVEKDTIIVTGITATNRKVTRLMSNKTYVYDVKAVYGNQESEWSNKMEVTTLNASLRLDSILNLDHLGQEFKFQDDLIVIHTNPILGRVWCKDQGNHSINPTNKRNDQIDYMRDVACEQTAEWDQSNWIMLQYPEDDGQNGIHNLLEGIAGKIIPAESIIVRYIDNVNYTFEVVPEEGEPYTLPTSGETTYEMNHYCVANFMPSNRNIDGGDGALCRVQDEDVYYFFMNPKIQEVCELTNAEFDGNGLFVVPSNNNQLKGALRVDWSYNADGLQSPEKGKIYNFTAIVNRVIDDVESVEKVTVNQGSYIVYPLDFNAFSSAVTAIENINGNRNVVGVEYVNAAGLVSNKPFSGVNIVVTRFSDGSSTVAKKLYK